MKLDSYTTYNRYLIHNEDQTELANLIAATEEKIKSSPTSNHGDKYGLCCLYYAYTKNEPKSAEKYAVLYKRSTHPKTLVYVIACNLLAYIYSMGDNYTRGKFALITSSFQESLDALDKFIEENPSSIKGQTSGGVDQNKTVRTEQAYALRNLALAHIQQFIYDPDPLLAMEARCKAKDYLSQAIEKFKEAISWQNFCSGNPEWPLGVELKQTEEDLEKIDSLTRTPLPQVVSSSGLFTPDALSIAKPTEHTSSGIEFKL